MSQSNNTYQPYFSVIVPVYNTEQYLENCIQSVLNQTFCDLELIIVDDGSPDCSIDIITRYALQDTRIKVVRKDNGGLVSARKAGMDVSCGKYIVCLDSDDWLEVNCLDIFFNIIKEYSTDVVIGAYFRSDESQSIVHSASISEGYYSRDRIKSDIHPILLESVSGKSFQPNVWGRAYKADLYKKVQAKVPNCISIGEDRCVVVPIIDKCESLYVVDRPVYNYRVDNTSSMTRVKHAFDLNYPKVIYDYFINNYELDDDLIKQLNRKYVHDLYLAYESQFNEYSYSEARKRIKQSIKHADLDLIKRCDYKTFTKGDVAKQAILKHLYFIMKLTSRR